MQRRISRRWMPILLSLLLAALVGPLGALAAPAQQPTGTYTNPLQPQIPGDGVVESCADPSTFYDAASSTWYMYCTSDPLNGQDKSGADFNFHKIPMIESPDLVNWTYVGDAFSAVPSWGQPSAGMWAPEIDYFDGQYYLYYVITDVKDTISGEPGCNSDNAIGVATSTSPTGPWSDIGHPLIAPRRGGGGCNFFWTFDPDVIAAQNGQKYIYYGSYYGGIFAQPLAANGLATSGPATQVTIANKYEGAEVVFKDGYYYLFVSATNCCNGPLTAYSVFAGRSTEPTGPFVDREGVSLLAGQVGGTPVISMNGNRWVGTGHNTVFQDFDGQWWTIYHAVDRKDPYFAGAVGFTKRPALLDPLDWVNGWPTVRGGLWASDEPMPAPAAQPGDITKYSVKKFKDVKIDDRLAAYSDEFNSTLGSQWSWVRPPTAGAYGLESGAFRFDTQAADLYVGNNSASVLLENAPKGDYVVETKVKLNLPAEGCCFNYVQAGMVIYGDDDNFIKLVHVSIWETRQTEFAKELSPVPAGFPRYGNTVVGPPNETTYLRIAKTTQGGQELYTAYTSRDGVAWVRGGTWTHQLGGSAKIGLVSMGGSGFIANFDYVRVYTVQ